VRAIQLTAEFSLAIALLAGVLIALAGAPSIRLLVVDPGVRLQAIALLPMVVILPLIGFPAWLLDGIFIGATRGRALRNAAILSTALYIATDLALRPWGATGIWLALLASYAYRALALGAHLPGLLRGLAGDGERGLAGG
jgi:MATE family multidrug resistance protein